MNITTQYTLTPAETLRGTRAFKRLWYAVSVGSGALVALLGSAVVVASEGQPVLGIFMIFNGLLFGVMPEALLVPERALEPSAARELETFLRGRKLLSR